MCCAPVRVQVWGLQTDLYVCVCALFSIAMSAAIQWVASFSKLCVYACVLLLKLQSRKLRVGMRTATAMVQLFLQNSLQFTH